MDEYQDHENIETFFACRSPAQLLRHLNSEQLNTLFNKLKDHNQRLKTIARVDPVTTLPNRHFFDLSLQRMLSQAGRYQRSLALLYLDLDGFKQVNDEHGHDCGDALLFEVAKRLKQKMRGEDFIARIGGDEFAIVLPEIKNFREAGQVAQAILKSITDSFSIKSKTITIGVSIGIACFPVAGETAQQLMKNADIALYQAKSKGKSRVEYYTGSLSQEFYKHQDLAVDIKNIIDNKQLHFFYQPRYYTKSGKLVGFDLSMQWHHPNLGIVKLDDFFSIAIKHNLMSQFTKALLNTAYLQYCELKKSHLMNEKYLFFINVSGCELLDEGFIIFLKELVARDSSFAKHLVIEKKSILSPQHFERYRSVFNQLRDMGIRLSIAQSSYLLSDLRILTDRCISFIVISKMVYQKSHDVKSLERLFAAFTAFYKKLDIQLIYDGVDTQEHHRLTKNGLIGMIQGDFLKTALQDSEIKNYLQEIRD